MNDVLSIEEKLSNINMNLIDDIRLSASLFLKKKKNYIIFIRLLFSYFVALPEKIEELCSLLRSIIDYKCIEDQEFFFSILISQIKIHIYKSREVKFAIQYLLAHNMLPSDVISTIKPLVAFKHEFFLPIDGKKVKIDENLHQNQLKKGKSPSFIVESIRNDDIESLITIFTNQSEENLRNFIIEKNPYERCEVIIDKKCTILDCAAFFCSVKCFKFLMQNNSKITSSTFQFAVMGGNTEIIHLIENDLNDLSETIKNDSIYIFGCSIKYRRTEIFEWILDKVRPIEIEKIQYLILVCASNSNYVIINNYLISSMNFSCLNSMYCDMKIYDWIITDHLFKMKRKLLSESQSFGKYKVAISQLFFNVVHQKQIDCLKIIVKNSPLIGQSLSNQFVEIIIKEFENNNLQVIHYLLNCSAFDVNLKNKLRRPEHFAHLKYNNQTKSLLLFCCDSNFEKLIEELIEINSIDFNSFCEDDNFKTRNAFDSICENGSKRMINLFLTHFQNKLNFNLPLHFSCRGKKIENFDFFLSKVNFDVNKVDHLKRTCLHYACQIDNSTFCEKLLSNPSVKFNLKDANQDSPFFTALKNGSIGCLKCFLNLNLIDINEGDIENDDTPLHIATKTNNIEIIKLILPNQNIDINKKNKDLNTPLHIACQKSLTLFVNLFLYLHQIDINIQNNNISKSFTFSMIFQKVNINDTPLHIACETCNKEIVDFLVKRKEIDANIRNKKGMTPLHLACLNEKIEIVKSLLTIPTIDCTIEDVLFIVIIYNVCLFIFFIVISLIFYFYEKPPLTCQKIDLSKKEFRIFFPKTNN